MSSVWVYAILYSSVYCCFHSPQRPYALLQYQGRVCGGVGVGGQDGHHFFHTAPEL